MSEGVAAPPAPLVLQDDASAVLLQKLLYFVAQLKEIRSGSSDLDYKTAL
jgi:hypothetical protein